jgi:hypothetical protein
MRLQKGRMILFQEQRQWFPLLQTDRPLHWLRLEILLPQQLSSLMFAICMAQVRIVLF